MKRDFDSKMREQQEYLQIEQEANVKTVSENFEKHINQEKVKITELFNQRIDYQSNQIKALLADRQKNVKIIMAMRKIYDENQEKIKRQEV
jgi:ribosomal protein L31E